MGLSDATVVMSGRKIMFRECSPDDYIEGWLLRGAYFESANLEFIKRLRVAGDYVDVGAYIGTHSTYFGLFCPAEHIYAFEPNPESYQKLVANLVVNGVGNCTANCMALSDSNGKAGLSSQTGNRGGTRLRDGNEVDVIALDSLKLKNIKLMKIDAEGMEMQILRGAIRTLATVDHLFIEILAPDSREQVFKLLHSLGFVFLALVGYNEHLHYFARAERKVAITVMACYPEIFDGFRESVERFAPDVPKILVRDGPFIPDPPGWTVVQGHRQFSYAGNRNLAWRKVPGDMDILDCTDDIRLTEENTIERLRDLAYSDPRLGILSPKIIGGAGNPLQNRPDQIRPITYSEMRIPFICTYVKRETITRVGYMDEQFAGYGFDDVDLCLRIKQEGYKLGIARDVSIKHGVGDQQWMVTTTKKFGNDTRWRQESINKELFRAKHGHTNMY